MKIVLDVDRVVIVRRTGHTDTVYLVLNEEQAKKVHPVEGGYWEIFQCADFRMEVTRGRGVEAAQALGIPDKMIEVVEV